MKQMITVVAVVRAIEMLEEGVTSSKAKVLKNIQLEQGIKDEVDRVYLMSLDNVIEMHGRALLAH